MTDMTTELAHPNTDLDSLGPVDYIVVEFPAGASNFTGEMAEELLALVDSGTIRVIDVLSLTKNEDGTVDAMELSDIEQLGPLQRVEAQLAELLAEEDVEHLAAALDPGSTAGVLIWENLWAAPFASAARRSGGQLIATGRIPIQAIIASIEADDASTTEGAGDAARTRTCGARRCHRTPRGDDRRRGQGGHAWPGACGQDYGRGGSRHSGSSPPDLTRRVSDSRRRSRKHRRDGRMAARVLSSE
jgi:hypothetical protein